LYKGDFDMFFRKITGVLLVVLIIAGLFGTISSSRYQAGWAQGYAAAQQVAAGEDGGTAAVPPAPRAFTGHGFYGLFWGLGFFFKFLFFLFFLGMIGRFFGFWFWRHRGRGPKQWRKHWHHKHDHTPPWYDHGDDDLADEPVFKA
jgi:hypothetical protein